MVITEQNTLGQYIPLHYHYQMLLDEARMTGFKKAISYLVRDGGTVAELGGGTGVLSFFAAQKASKVWCVEHNPQMVEAARRYLSLNNCAEKVEVIEADASKWVPPAPVDVVICEMLHSALLREKQLEVIAAFKKNYAERVSPTLPAFIPEATILALQPVQQQYNFHGYNAPMPVFYQPTVPQADTVDLGDPVMYSVFQYKDAFPHSFQGSFGLTISRPGEWNALRFITKNILAIVVEQNSTIDWHNFYLIIPLPKALTVIEGQRYEVSFSYAAGQPIEALTGSLHVR